MEDWTTSIICAIFFILKACIFQRTGEGGCLEIKSEIWKEKNIKLIKKKDLRNNQGLIRGVLAARLLNYFAYPVLFKSAARVLAPEIANFIQSCSKSKKKKKKKKWKTEKKEKSLQHLLFPGGHPSKYWAGPTLLNFGDRTRTGVLNVVWS